MKITHQHFGFMFMAAGTIFSLGSCYTGGTISDPYIVSESRQKENFYYIPSAPNTPLHSQKNDLEFNLMLVSGSKYSGAEVQASYMPGKHIGIMGSYSIAGINSNYVKYNRFELGSGFATQFSGNWHFETYAGFGNGKIKNRHYTGNSKLNLTHFFLQPAIAISNENKRIQFGFVSRFAAVNFNVLDTSFSNDREPYSTTQLKSLYDQPFHIVWEPGFVFRFGWKNFQFHTGYSFSTDLTNPGLYKANGNLSMGITLRLNTQHVLTTK
jgi:hypothetical protein